MWGRTQRLDEVWSLVAAGYITWLPSFLCVFFFFKRCAFAKNKKNMNIYENPVGVGIPVCCFFHRRDEYLFKNQEARRTFCATKPPFFKIGGQKWVHLPPNRAESLKTKTVWSVLKLSFEGVVDSWGRSQNPRKRGPKKKSHGNPTNSWNGTKNIRRLNPPGGTWFGTPLWFYSGSESFRFEFWRYSNWTKTHETWNPKRQTQFFFKFPQQIFVWEGNDLTRPEDLG